MKKIIKNKAFTLAEVLITLTIIGVIAALTIPNLMKKWQDHADVVRVKEAYSILSNAVKMAITENGPLDEWAWPDTDKSQYLARQMSKYLKVQKKCYEYTAAEGRVQCWNYGYFDDKSPITSINTDNAWINAYFLFMDGRIDGTNGPNRNRAGGMILQNGMIIDFTKYGDSSDPIGYVLIDINGKTKPNKWGYDIFKFDITPTGMTPIIKYWYAYTNNNYKSICNKGSTGDYCSMWIMKKGNMDYKYRDVSAEW